LRRRAAIKFAYWMRWLHIYMSMFGLAAVTFFGVTGLTLNHPDWFLSEMTRQAEIEGTIPRALLNRAGAADDDDPALQVAKLEVVETLRNAHQIHGALADFQVDDVECSITFKGPGYAADVLVDRETGRYELTQSSFGLVAVLNDLHKGRDTGFAWSLLIDVSAIIMTLIALTGLILLFYLKLRRVPGVVIAVVGTIAVIAVFLLGVP
jgi:hypothetical protein